MNNFLIFIHLYICFCISDCWTQGSPWRGPVLEAKIILTWFIYYHPQCLSGLYIETNPRSKLQCDCAATHLQGNYGIKQTSWWTCETEPYKWVCSWFGGYSHLDHERYCCWNAEYWLKPLLFCIVFLFLLSFYQRFCPK